MTMNSLFFVDSNILLYSLDESDKRKQLISEKLLDANPCICSQNISEFVNVITRRWKYSKADTALVLSAILKVCKLIHTPKHTLQHAIKLIDQYDFQIFDAIIVASALEAGCTTLYTEDMQHGLVVDKQLTINNPFL